MTEVIKDFSSTETIWKETNKQIRQEEANLFLENMEGMRVSTYRYLVGADFLTGGSAFASIVLLSRSNPDVIATAFIVLVAGTVAAITHAPKKQDQSRRLQKLIDFREEQIAYLYDNHTDEAFSEIQEKAQQLLAPERSKNNFSPLFRKL